MLGDSRLWVGLLLARRGIALFIGAEESVQLSVTLTKQVRPKCRGSEIGRRDAPCRSDFREILFSGKEQLHSDPWLKCDNTRRDLRIACRDPRHDPCGGCFGLSGFASSSSEFADTPGTGAGEAECCFGSREPVLTVQDDASSGGNAARGERDAAARQSADDGLTSEYRAAASHDLHSLGSLANVWQRGIPGMCDGTQPFVAEMGDIARAWHIDISHAGNVHIRPKAGRVDSVDRIATDVRIWFARTVDIRIN
jgi:hypothetical protein